VRPRDIVVGLLGLAIGVFLGLLIPRDPSPARVDRPAPQLPETAIDRELPGDVAASPPADDLQEPSEAGGSGAAPAPRPAEPVRGLRPLKLETEADRPFVKFASANLPTIDQVRDIVEISEREYAVLQVSAHAEALRAILGDAFDVLKERETERFIDEWACRKHRSHQEYVTAVDRARSALAAGPALDEELRRLAREWALAHASLKREKSVWLARAFAGEFPTHEDAMRRLARHSEVAATLRVDK
jgi:hypothetical protein